MRPSSPRAELPPAVARPLPRAPVPAPAPTAEVPRPGASPLPPPLPLAARARAYAELARVPNLFTAAANVLAGWAVAGGGASATLLGGMAASMLLYAGGVALNDWYDRALDARERPERPIPSGRVAPRAAMAFGAALLGAGVLLALLVAPLAGLLAAVVAVGAIAYDARLKHHPAAGALAMGSLRGLNVALGMALLGAAALARAWPLALAAFAHTAALTWAARAEVHGGSRAGPALVLAVDGALAAGLVALALAEGLPHPGWGVACALLFLAAGLRGWLPALRAPAPSAALVRRGVVAGVLGLVLLDAALAAGFGGPWWGAAVLLLLAPAYAAARLFPVT